MDDWIGWMYQRAAIESIILICFLISLPASDRRERDYGWNRLFLGDWLTDWPNVCGCPLTIHSKSCGRAGRRAGGRDGSQCKLEPYYSSRWWWWWSSSNSEYPYRTQKSKQPKEAMPGRHPPNKQKTQTTIMILMTEKAHDWSATLVGCSQRKITKYHYSAGASLLLAPSSTRLLPKQLTQAQSWAVLWCVVVDMYKSSSSFFFFF